MDESDASDRPITEGRLNFMFKDMKEFVFSTVKGSETVLRKEFRAGYSELKGDIHILQNAVTEHSRMIKNLDAKIETFRTELNTKIDNVHAELNTKIDNVHAGLNAKIDSVDTGLNAKIDSVDTGLNAKIDSMDTGLNTKIDSVNTGLTARMDRMEDNMGLMEKRLAAKIDGQMITLHDFDKRITVLENGRN